MCCLLPWCSFGLAALASLQRRLIATLRPAWQQRLPVPVPMGLLVYPEAILSDVMALNTLSKVGGH